MRNQMALDQAGAPARITDWAAWASGICAVHCAVGPALALALPVFALGEVLERALLLALLPIAVWALWRGWREHRQAGPALAGGAGIVGWLVAMSDATPAGEEALMIAGGVLLFVALRWSARLQRRCACVVEAGSQLSPAPGSSP